MSSFTWYILTSTGNKQQNTKKQKEKCKVRVNNKNQYKILYSRNQYPFKASLTPCASSFTLHMNS